DSAGRNQLRFVISPEGRVTEHRYDTFGNRVSTIAFGAASYPVESLTATGVPPETHVAGWASSQDPSRSLRTDYTFDFRGQVERTLSYAQLDTRGNGVMDQGARSTRFFYGPTGLLLTTIDPNGNVTTQTHDGLGRVLSSTDALNQVTLSQYDDAHYQASITLANGLVTTSTYDRAGRLVSVMQSSQASANLGETSYAYDAAGRLVMTRDATGRSHWTLHDDAGRKAGDIDSDGTLTEYVYHANNLLAATIVHANPVNVGVLTGNGGQPTNPALSTVRPAASDKDQRSWRVYDSANRLVQTIDGEGFVTANEYDGASRIIATRQHANAVSVPATGAAPISAPVVPVASAADRVNRSFYNADGLLVGQLDAENYYTQYRYDAAGRKTAQTRFATPMAGTLTNALTPPIVVLEGSPIPMVAYVVQRAEGGAVRGVPSNAGDGSVGVFDMATLKARLEAFKAVDEAGAFRDLVALVRYAAPTLKAAGFDAAALLRSWISALPANSPTRNAVAGLDVVLAGSSPVNGNSASQLILGDSLGNAIYGGGGNDYIDAGAGDDNTIFGDAGDDTIDGGAGNDWLNGGQGADTYLFGWGSGKDTINNAASDPLGPTPDTVLMGAGVTPSNVRVTRTANELVLRLSGSDDQLTILNYFMDDGVNNWNVGTVRFANGTVWTMADVKALATRATAQDDALLGYASDDAIAGGTGNDTITGKGGADTLRGDAGEDSLSGDDGDDELSGGADSDTLTGGAGIDLLLGGAGADSLVGGMGDDTLDGGAGNDTLKGGEGSNTYLFGIGSGQDTIDNSNTAYTG
ncbi:calcium-binding protein, partial [Rhizobacter sp. Root1221]|uniref:calcium-binding protein n=1 Tax=Rhizobacter sp. Root1221 TaxID=1736433 RepID=UPI000A5DA251